MECTDGPESDNKRDEGILTLLRAICVTWACQEALGGSDEDDKAVLTSTELESQFIVDGKHVPSEDGLESERTTYYSYKLRHVGYRFQCVVT